MKGWENRAIRTLGRVVTGKTPSKDIVDFWQGNELFVSPRDMEYDSRYITNTQSKISVKALQKFTGQKIPKNTVMYTALSYGFGKIGIASKQLITNQQINSIIVNKENDFRFVYYLLRLNTPYIFSFNSGIDTPIVPKSVFEKIKLAVPSLLIQRKIAAILSAYDDLIENNNRRIAILEKMAEELYREWFVRLRFPGHEKVKIVKGVPEGWKAKKLKDIVLLAYGKALKESTRFNGRVPVYGSSGIIGYHNQAICKGPGIIVGRKGNVGSIIWASTDFYPIDTTYYVISKYPLSYIYYLLRSMNFINNDAAVPGLNREQAYSNDFFLPEKRLVFHFSDTLLPLVSHKDLLQKSIQNLTASRDRLLSRLMSGAIDVENLDIEFPKSMQEEAIDA